MNIVVKNQNYKITDSLNIEVIKTLSGEFSLNELKKELINFYFNKIIIDITAIRNYYDINSVLEFLREFEPSKVIILLNDSEVINSNSFLGILVENGYYNFTRNAAGINYLLDNPNEYDDVKKHINTSSSINVLNPTYRVGNYIEETQSVKEEINEFEKKNKKQKIIGVQNITDHAGATTLTYMLVKQLKLNYSVKGIEMNKQDFVYFRDPDLTLCTSIDDLKLKFKEYANIDVIVIDLNSFDAYDYCDEILYLIDPGLIKLNKLIKKDNNIYLKVKNGKIILNRSAIKEEEIPTIEYETKFKVFYNMPNFNDRKERIQIIDILLYKLGFNKQNPNTGIFGNIFQKK
ncbi:MAG: hypothetical protein PHS24_02370 [Bacilli bacterium]|nr:hypothetical protein [Bacilli bacterium]